MKFTVFVTVMFVIFLVAKIATGCYTNVMICAAMQKPLLWLSVGFGVVAGICFLIKIIKEIKELFKK